MKYSILMPYHKRSNLLNVTLLSFDYHYKNRDDYEVIIIEDFKNFNNKEEHEKLLEVISKYKNVKLYSPEISSFNPSKLFNYGIDRSNGEYIILTNPEIVHFKNVLDGLDEEFLKNFNNYIICSCQSSFKSKIDINKFEEFQYSSNEWYQHTLYNNRRLHFCSAIKKELIVKIGKFDETYDKGISYDDDDLRNNIINNGINIINRDDLVTVHLEHDRYYQQSQQHLININRNYYLNKWRNFNIGVV